MPSEAAWNSTKLIQSDHSSLIYPIGDSSVYKAKEKLHHVAVFLFTPTSLKVHSDWFRVSAAHEVRFNHSLDFRYFT